MRVSSSARVVAVVAMAACGSGSGADVPSSPCVAFARASAASLRVEAATPVPRASALLRLVGFGGHAYALDGAGSFGRVDADAAALVATNGGVDFAIGKDGSGMVQAFVARWSSASAGAPTTFELVRFASADGGLTFDASGKVVSSVPGGRAGVGEATSLAFAPDGLLFVALGDAYPPDGAAASLLGKVLRIDVTSGAAPEIWATGVHEPRGLDVDPDTGDVWLGDRLKDDTPVVHRLTSKSATPVVPTLYINSPSQRASSTGGLVYRGKAMPRLVGKYLYTAFDGALVAVDRFGPSGPAQASTLAAGVSGTIGHREDGEIAAVVGSGVGQLVDGAPPSPAPPSLLATRCFDIAAPSGAPAGAIPYDVTTPLWSDGAAKERFVVLPKAGALASRPDGDLVFPVGTVAVKTFSVDGKRVETRLLVQHDVEDWVGYSYAWNAEGTDAQLVSGNRTVALAGGKTWYFPAPADCAACHTPAAGYTLGLEGRQLVGRGEALAQLEKRLPAPLDRASLGTLVPLDAPPPASAEARARSYLHSNCSVCHREGSATGTTAELDLRRELPLGATGLCREPQVGSLGIQGARIVTPGDPTRSVLVARMRTTSDLRMPKLASHVVDEAAVAAIEQWIRELASCP